MNQLGKITAFFNEIKTNLGFSNQTKIKVRKTSVKVSGKTVKAKTRTRVRTSKKKSVRKRK